MLLIPECNVFGKSYKGELYQLNEASKFKTLSLVFFKKYSYYFFKHWHDTKLAQTLLCKQKHQVKSLEKFIPKIVFISIKHLFDFLNLKKLHFN